MRIRSREKNIFTPAVLSFICLKFRQSPPPIRIRVKKIALLFCHQGFIFVCFLLRPYNMVLWTYRVPSFFPRVTVRSHVCLLWPELVFTVISLWKILKIFAKCYSVSLWMPPPLSCCRFLKSKVGSLGLIPQ